MNVLTPEGTHQEVYVLRAATLAPEAGAILPKGVILPRAAWR